MKKRKRNKQKNYKKGFNKKADNFFKVIFSIPGFFILGLIAYFLDPGGFFQNIFDVGKGFGYVIALMILGIVGWRVSTLIDKGYEKEREEREKRD